MRFTSQDEHDSFDREAGPTRKGTLARVTPSISAPTLRLIRDESAPANQDTSLRADTPHLHPWQPPSDGHEGVDSIAHVESALEHAERKMANLKYLFARSENGAGEAKGEGENPNNRGPWAA